MKKYITYIRDFLESLKNKFHTKDNKKIILYISKENEHSRLIELLKALGKNSKFLITHSQKENYDSIIIKVDSLVSLGDEKFVKAKVLELENNDKSKIVFDLSIEGIDIWGHHSELLFIFHKILRDLRIEQSRVILINSNSNSRIRYLEWAYKFSRDYTISVIGYNFYLFEYYCECLKNEWLIKNHNSVIENSTQILSQNQYDEDRKYFMCLNLRSKGHRRAIVLFLIKNNFLNKGIVTYFGDYFGKKDRDLTKEEEAMTVLHDRKLELQVLFGQDEDISDYIPKLDELSPIIFDRNSDKMRNDLWRRKVGEVNFLIPELEFDLSFKKPLSYFEIVTESWFTDERCLYFTEKTIRPILRLNPFIIVGCPGTLKYLKSVGFKTFSPFIDESYDEISSTEFRMKAIFKEIKRLCELDKEEIHKMYQKLLPILQHNLTHFMNNTGDIIDKELEENILPFLKKV